MKKAILSLITLGMVLVTLVFQVQIHAVDLIAMLPEPNATPIVVETYVEGDFEGVYSEKYKGILIRQYKGSRDVKEVMVPSHFDDIPVVGLSTDGYKYIFRAMWSLEKVVLPETVVVIDGPVFYNCTSLKVIEGLKEDVQYVLSGDAFLSTPWYKEKMETAPNGMVIIGTTLYNMASAKGDVLIPEGVTSICSDALYMYERNGEKKFFNADITSVSIPFSLTDTSNLDLLRFLDKLESIRMQKSCTTFYCIDGVLYDGNYIAVYPQGKKTKKYNVPENVKTIYSLSSEYIEHIKFEGSSIFLDDGALSECKNLKKISLPKNAELGTEVFAGTKLKQIHLTKNTICNYDRDYIDSEPEDSSGVNLYDVNTKMTVAKPTTCCKSTFSGCTTLKKITVNKKNKKHFVKEGALYLKNDNGEIFLLDYPAARKGKTLIVKNGTSRVFSLQYARNLRTVVFPDTVDTVYFDLDEKAYNHIKTIKYTGVDQDWEWNVFVGGGRSKYFKDGYSVDLSKVKVIYRAKSIKKAKIKLKVPVEQLRGKKLRSKVEVEYKGGKLDKESFNVSAEVIKKVVRLTVTGKGEFYGKLVKKYKK